MSYRNTPITVTYLAWDTVNNIGKTGDGANHTLRGVGDGTEFTPASPSITEVDSTNCKGLYTATFAAGENNYAAITLMGKSSTAGVIIVPTLWQNESNANAVQWLGAAIFPVSVSGLPVVDLLRINGGALNTNSAQLGVNVVTVAGTTQTAADIGMLAKAKLIRTNTARAGSTTTLQLDAGASSTGDLYKGDLLVALSGAGAGQSTRITSYDGTSQTATFTAVAATFDSSTVFAIIAEDGTVTNFSGEVAASSSFANNLFSLLASATVGGVEEVLLVDAIASAERNALADAFLNRNIAGGGSGGSRTVRSAFRFLRNKVSIAAGVMTVYQEDDSTSDWTATVTTTAGNPISTIDPA